MKVLHTKIRLLKKQLKPAQEGTEVPEIENLRPSKLMAPPTALTPGSTWLIF